MADDSAEPTSAFDGMTVPPVLPTVIHDTDILLLPRLFLMVALKENMANLQENADREHLGDFWDRLTEILQEIQKAVSKIEGSSELEDGILRAKDVVDTKLVPYLQSLRNVPQMLDSYLPKAGQTWNDFLQGKPEHERRLVMAELDIQDFHDHLPNIVLLYMDEFLEDVNEFRQCIASPELLLLDPSDQSGTTVDATPYSAPPTSVISGLNNPSFPSTPIQSKKKNESYTVVKVYYATDRKLENGEYKYNDLPLVPAIKSTPASSPDDVVLHPLRPLEYGFVGVSIPSIHKRGEVESPNKWLLQTENPYKHVMILPEYDLKLRGDEGKFFTILNEDITNNGKITETRDLLIFIHGYNSNHDGTLKQAAQLKFDLEFEGAVVAYSWSSKDSYWGYYPDQVAIKNTVESLKGFLLAIMAKMAVPTRIHLLAHSMGNRAMIEALDLLHDEHQIPKLPHPRCPIATVISAAADDRPIHWENLLAKMKKVYLPDAEGKFSRPLLSVYSSNRDVALRLSREIHKEVRLGETDRLFESLGGAPMLTLDDHDAIDATGVNKKFPFIGHSYFADSPQVIADIHALITKSIRANGRGLHNVQKSGFNFFAFIRAEWFKFIKRSNSLEILSL